MYLVVLVDERAVFFVGHVQRHTGADVGARKELLVQFASDLGVDLLQASRTFDADGRRVPGVHQYAVRRARQSRVTANRSAQVQLVVRVAEHLGKIEFARRAWTEEQ